MFREDYTTTEQQPITYSLRAGGTSSDAYYSDVAEFVDVVIENWDRETRTLRQLYMEWIDEGGREALRTAEEYTFDILTLGVMWRNYGGRARRVPFAATVLCSALYRLRRRWPRLKPYLDSLRGRFSGRYLTPGEHPDETEHLPSGRDLLKLLRWMDATGEYREETARVRILIRFLRSRRTEERQWHLEHIHGMTRDFEKRALRHLGTYTAGVEAFLRDRAPAYRGREDALLVSRKRVEYHLSMLGAELMNRSFRASYDRTPTRAVLLPACMRGASAAHCRAAKMDLDLVCAQCDRNCRIGQITGDCEALGIETRIIPHSSDFTRWLRNWAAGRDIGVIGVACALHLMTGGLELRSLGIPAQCVLLDFCGCRQHWDPDGRRTALNSELLLGVASRDAYLSAHACR